MRYQHSLEKKLMIGLTAIVFTLSSCSYLGIEDDNLKARKLLEDKIELLDPEYIPMRFKILENKNDNIRVAIKFFDPQGKVVYRTEEHLKGNQLLFNFLELEVQGSSIILPYKMFSDKVIQEKGAFLPNYYQKSGFPEIFNSKDIHPKLKEGLTTLLSKVSSGKIDTSDVFLKGMEVRLPESQSYQVKKKYKFVTKRSGQILVLGE